MARVFDHHPNSDCPICGTNRDGKSVLIPIHGTQDGNEIKAVPIHLDCLLSNSVLYPYDTPTIAAFSPYYGK